VPVAPTIYQVAREAGVSIATVSRALRRPGDLRPATRDRVLRAVADLGYVPSGPAHGLATGRTRVLGLARAGVSDAEVEEGHETLLFSDEVLRGMERSARLAGYAVLLASADDAGRRFDLELAAKTDGMVVLARTMPAEELERLARRVPVVLAAGSGTPAGVDRVSVANAEGTAAVTAHLLREHGAGRLAFLGGPADSPDAAARFQGYRAALAGSGRPAPDRPDAVRDSTEAGGRAAMRALLAGAAAAANQGTTTHRRGEARCAPRASWPPSCWRRCCWPPAAAVATASRAPGTPTWSRARRSASSRSTWTCRCRGWPWSA
jgi:LacI family transcriptional regulator